MNRVIYHANCFDGFTAAWAAKRFLPEDTQFYPATHGDTPPPVTKNDTVYILDFSFPRETLIELNEKAGKLILLDHHKSAQAHSGDLPFCIFDMERSGCRMAWDFFSEGALPPKWLLYVEDRDLWRMAYDDTPYFHAYLASQEMTFENWDRINEADLLDMVSEGVGIKRFIDNWIKRASKQARQVELLGYKAMAVNVPYQNASELANYLLETNPEYQFSVGYFRRADRKWQYSLRSRSDFDVSEIAQHFGGGGHKRAAGFETEVLVLDGV